jgi:hypothetical protein
VDAGRTQVREFLKGFRHLHQFGNRELLQPTHDGVARLLAIISDREAKLAAAECEVGELTRRSRFTEQNRVAALRALLSHLDYRCGPNPVWKSEMDAARAALEGRDE